jgi:hypothetical protein
MGENKSLPLSVISATLPVIKDVVAVIEEHQKNAQTESRLVNALKSEMNAISSTCDSLSDIGKKQFFPLLKTIHVAPTRTQLNEIVTSLTQLYRDYADLLIEFQSLANKCKQVSLNTGFMKELKDYSTELFDFVSRLGETSTKNRIEFNDGFYGFIQLYGNEPFKKIKESEMAKMVKETEHLISLVKNIIKPSLTRESIDRAKRKEFIKVCKELMKASKAFKVKYAKIVEIRNYIPESLHQLISMLEKVYPIESEIIKSSEHPEKSRR